MSWLSKILGGGGGSQAQNLAGLDSSDVSFLKQDLGKLDRVAAGLGERALRFVLDGEDADVLLVLGGAKGGGKALDLICARQSYGRRHNPSRVRFLTGLDQAAAAPALRLAQVYEAASRQERRNPGISALAIPPWLPIYPFLIVRGITRARRELIELLRRGTARTGRERSCRRRTSRPRSSRGVVRR